MDRRNQLASVSTMNTLLGWYDEPMRQSTDGMPQQSSAANRPPPTRRQFILNGGHHRSAALLACVICSQQLTEQAFPVELDCQHTYCRDCLVTHLTDLIDDGLYEQLKCSAPDCDEAIYRDTIQKLLPIELVDKLDDGMTKKALAFFNREGVFFCPNEACEQPMKRDEETASGLLPTPGLATCFHCHFVFCVGCLGEFHGIADCPTNANGLARCDEAPECEEEHVKSEDGADPGLGL